MPDTWHLLGAGSMGSLAAHFLAGAGFNVVVHARQAGGIQRRLLFPDGSRTDLRLPAASASGPIDYLLIATKAADTVPAITPLLSRLTANSTLVRFQNGMGSLDCLTLPSGLRMIDAITTSGAWRDGNDIHIAAINQTWFGDGSNQPPNWFATLTKAWPDLHWRDDILFAQLQKLSVNAIINPLTALHDCPNGAIATQPALKAAAETLASEIDVLLAELFPGWPDDTLARTMEVARLTAGNTSSMRADLRAGRRTEIDYITGWLCDQATRHHIAMPANQSILAQIHARLA